MLSSHMLRVLISCMVIRDIVGVILKRDELNLSQQIIIVSAGLLVKGPVRVITNIALDMSLEKV